MNDENEQLKQIVQIVFTLGSKSTKYKIKDINSVPQILKMMGEENLQALIEGLQKVKTEEEAVALYDAVMDKVSQPMQARLGGILNYINKLNNR